MSIFVPLAVELWWSSTHLPRWLKLLIGPRNASWQDPVELSHSGCWTKEPVTSGSVNRLVQAHRSPISAELPLQLAALPPRQAVSSGSGTVSENSGPPTTDHPSIDPAASHAEPTSGRKGMLV